MSTLSHLTNKQVRNYFKNHVAAIISLSPPPKTATELEYLMRHFKKLSSLETATATPLAYQSYNKSGFYLKLLYSVNPKLHHMGPVDSKMGELFDKDALIPQDPTIDIQQEKQKLVNKINNLVAIPRHSLIVDDQQFQSGESKLQYLHTLSDNTQDISKYRLTDATVDNPFISFESCDLDKDMVRAKMRHNYRTFHKFRSIVTYDHPTFILKRFLF